MGFSSGTSRAGGGKPVDKGRGVLDGCGLEGSRGAGAQSTKDADALGMDRHADLAHDRMSLGLGSWPDLPGTLKKVTSIGAGIPGSVVLSGGDASEKMVKQLSRDGTLRLYRVLHFATHGVLVPGAPELSALVLSEVGLSVSLWQVADDSTREFMVGTYRLVHEKGLSFARAMTEMKRPFIYYRL